MDLKYLLSILIFHFIVFNKIGSCGVRVLLHIELKAFDWQGGRQLMHLLLRALTRVFIIEISSQVQVDFSICTIQSICIDIVLGFAHLLWAHPYYQLFILTIMSKH